MSETLHPLPPLRDGALHERVILITGAGDGLGKAVALRAAAAGATVVLLGRTIPKLEASYDAITAAGGAEPAIYPMDLAGASDRELYECILRVRDNCGALHGVVHAAAQWAHFRPMDEILPTDWVAQLQANLTAPWTLTRAALPVLREAGDGCVIFTGCECGRNARGYYGAYGVAKFALRGMVAGWAAEVPGVRMHLFDPGPMRTRMRLLGYPGQKPESLPMPEHAAEQLSALLDPACGRQIAGRLEWEAAPPPAATH